MKAKADGRVLGTAALCQLGAVAAAGRQASKDVVAVPAVEQVDDDGV